MSASSKKKLRKEQNAAQLTEKQLTEQKEAKKLKTYTTLFVVVIALVTLVGLGSLAFTAYSNSGIGDRATKALTVGEHTLSSAELNYFYMDTVNETYQNWYNSFGEYTASYVSMFYGLDLAKPLNEQMYDEEAGTTYADYFVDLAVDRAVDTYAVYDKAVAEGYTMTEEEKTAFDASIANLKANATTYGYSNEKDFLKAYYGPGATVKSFKEYMEILSLVSSYELSIYDGLTYTVADLDNYNTEHFDEYSSFSYLSYYMTDDDFLVCTKEADDEDHTHTEDELSKALSDLTAATDTLLDAKPTDEESFNAALKAMPPYAEDEAAVCNAYEDTLYTGISDEDLAKWLIEEGRSAGDMVALPNITESTDDDGNTTSTVNGYNVVLFLGRNDNNMQLANVRHILKSFEGGTTDENGNTVYTDEEMAASETFLKGLQETWLSGGGNEDAFAELAKSNSTDGGSASNGGLYENVYPGQMVPAFNDWCFDEARKEGDYGIVKTEYGYHLIYFVGKADTTYRNYMIENDMREADYNAWHEEVAHSVEHTVHNTSKLALDLTLAR